MSAPVDERLGLPSASEYPRIVACPGYLQLKRRLPPKDEKQSEDAASGIRIHAALNSLTLDGLSGLSDEEKEVGEKCARQFQSLVERLKFPPEGKTRQFFGEKRLFMTKLGKKLFSGQIDRFELCEGTGVMVDWKTGRKPVTPAESNMQMRAYAVLIGENFDPGSLYVAIVQPWVTPSISVAEYDRASIELAREEMLENLAKAEDKNAARIPGPQCEYCPCKEDCPESRAVPIHLSTIDPTAEITNAQIAEFLDKVSLAEQVIDAIKTEAKRRIAEGQDIVSSDGGKWVLKPGAIQTKISDGEMVYSRAADHGVTHDAFLKSIEIKKGVLKEILKSATQSKGIALDAILDSVLSGCVTEKQNAPSLVKEKTA